MKDREFLNWVHDRMINVYGENRNIDFLHKLRAIIRNYPQDKETPNIGS